MRIPPFEHPFAAAPRRRLHDSGDAIARDQGTYRHLRAFRPGRRFTGSWSAPVRAVIACTGARQGRRAANATGCFELTVALHATAEPLVRDAVRKNRTGSRVERALECTCQSLATNPPTAADWRGGQPAPVRRAQRKRPRRSAGAWGLQGNSGRPDASKGLARRDPEGAASAAIFCRRPPGKDRRQSRLPHANGWRVLLPTTDNRQPTTDNRQPSQFGSLTTNMRISVMSSIA